MLDRINFIASQFLGNVDIIMSDKLKGGNINHTFLIKIKQEPNKMYVLQQVNNAVFKDIPALMNNLQMITQHLQAKKLQFSDNFSLKTFSYYPTRESGKYYYIHSDNSYWRISDYIDNVPVSDRSTDQYMAAETGKLFGFFLSQLSDLNLNNIVEVIPGFHDSHRYYQAFVEAVKIDVTKKLNLSEAEYSKLIEYSWLIEEYVKITKSKEIPLRLVHNDTKIDNILFNREMQAIAIIDFDTCMPGYLMSDFGDSIRSIANNGQEDDKDLAKVFFNMELFKSYAKNFIANVDSIITAGERINLALFALILTYEQAIRFYTDYLNNDVYYQIDYPDHNLHRARAQLKLLDHMNENYSGMSKFINSL